MTSKKRIVTAIKSPRTKDEDVVIGRAAFDAHRATRRCVLPADVVERLWAATDGPLVAFWIAVGKEDQRQGRDLAKRHQK